MCQALAEAESKIGKEPADHHESQRAVLFYPITWYSIRSFSMSVPCIFLSSSCIAAFSFNPSFISESGRPSRMLIVAFNKSRTSYKLPQTSGTPRSTCAHYFTSCHWFNCNGIILPLQPLSSKCRESIIRSRIP